MAFDTPFSFFQIVAQFTGKGAGVGAGIFTLLMMSNKDMWNRDLVHFPAIFWIIYILVGSFVVMLPFFLINGILLALFKFKLSSPFHYLALFLLGVGLALLVFYFLIQNFGHTDKDTPLFVATICVACGLSNVIAGWKVLPKG